MEVCFNFRNKLLIGAHIMRVSEKTEVIPPEQYLGSKVHNAIESGLNNDFFLRPIKIISWDAWILLADAHVK